MIKLIWKRNNKQGFSLTELLVAVLILSMVSAVVAGGIPVAKDAYEKITVSANAQVMLSTTITALRNELCTASDIRISGTTVRYYSSSIENDSELLIGKEKTDTAHDTILLKQYADYEKADDNVRALVSKAVGDKQLYVTYTSVTNGSGIITFNTLIVCDKTEKQYAHQDKVEIRLPFDD